MNNVLCYTGSQYKIEYALESCNMEDHKVDLSHLQLTALYHCQYLMGVHTVDLSHNQLTSRSLHQLHPLQCCQVCVIMPCIIQKS